MQAEQCFVRTYDLLKMMRPQRSDNSSGTTPDEACAAAQPKSQYASERCANSKRCLEAMQEVTGRELRASHTHIPRPRHADQNEMQSLQPYALLCLNTVFARRHSMAADI